MLKNVFCLLLFFTTLLGSAQQCPTISYPVDGETDIPVDATLTWQEVTGINGYLVSLGTTPGGTDLLNRAATGIINSYKPPVGFPDNTRIYMSLGIINSNAQPVSCGSIVFTTVDVTTSPSCTILVGPDDNAADVTIVTDIIWAYSPTATSYNVSIGTSEGGTDLLNDVNVGNVLSYDPPVNLPRDLRIYVTIRPENENGAATPCIEESFFTGPVDDPCEEVDPVTGEIISSRPVIEFPTLFIKCENSGPKTVSPQGQADGYRWYKIDGTSETLLSQNRNFQITEAGNFVLESYNYITKSGIQLECASFNNFNVVTSEPAIIESVDIRELTVGKQVIVNVIGNGEYEYTLDDENGIYQDENIFVDIADGPHTIYVRDKNGCGIVSRLIERGIKRDDFPNFFTPNGDGVNDFWQFVLPPEITSIPEVLLGDIYIFDRYGNFLLQLDPASRGWNGNFLGKPLPSSDYWFKATAANQKNLVGHFTLKR